MAFPTNATVLDAFNRSNGFLGADWTEMLGGAHEIVSNQVRGPSSDQAVAGWDGATFGPNCEVYIDIPTIGATDDVIGLYLRMTTLNLETCDGYGVNLSIASGTDTLAIYRVDNGAHTQLGATINNNFANGDSLGLEVIGSTIKAYKKTGGAWSDISSGGRSDSTYGSAGYFYMLTTNTTYRLDNFSGGTVVAAAAGKPWYVMWQ